MAFITSAYVSLLTQQWYAAIERCLAGQNCVLRPLYFAHWEESSIIETAERSDGIFLLPTLDPVPSRVVERLANCGKPVAVLSRDWSKEGFVSIDPAPFENLALPLERLYELGHRRIDCFNTQPCDSTIARSFEFWRGWLAGRGLKGELYNDPVDPYGDTLEQAFRYAKRLLEGGDWSSKAVLCTTMTAAIGLMRAMSDCGLKPGFDADVCAVNGVGYAKYLTPSLTSLSDPPLDGFVARVASWLLAGGRREDWEGPLRLLPQKPQLFIGESTSGECLGR